MTPRHWTLAQFRSSASHGGHVTDIHAIMRAIFSDWLPASGRQAAAAPLFERYGPEFDPRTGAGGFDVCVPLKV